MTSLLKTPLRLVLIAQAMLGIAAAHDLGIARVAIHQTGAGVYQLEAKLPLGNAPGAPVFPQRFQVSERASAEGYGLAGLHVWTAQSDGSPLSSQDTIVLPWARDGAFVTVTWRDDTVTGQFFPLSGNQTLIEVGQLGGAAPPLRVTLARYGRLGIGHILTGWDHLAFVLAIFLVMPGWGLIRLITAFTLGHSVTLIAAFLGWLHVPSPPVEAAIALSIVLVAVQAVSRRHQLQHGMGIVFCFGLLHGLGFAGALSDAAIPKNELISGLLAFNAGVEIGQLAFILIIVGVVACARALLSSCHRPVPAMLRPSVALCLVAVGTFWMVQRVAGFAG